MLSWLSIHKEITSTFNSIDFHQVRVHGKPYYSIKISTNKAIGEDEKEKNGRIYGGILSKRAFIRLGPKAAFFSRFCEAVDKGVRNVWREVTMLNDEVRLVRVFDLEGYDQLNTVEVYVFPQTNYRNLFTTQETTIMFGLDFDLNEFHCPEQYLIDYDLKGLEYGEDEKRFLAYCVWLNTKEKS